MNPMKSGNRCPIPGPQHHMAKVAEEETMFLTSVACGHVENTQLPGTATVTSRNMAAKSLVLKIIHLNVKFLVSGRENISII